MRSLNVTIIKSPSELKRNKYEIKELKNVSKKLALFEEVGKTPLELQEIAIQKSVNYDGFWTSPQPNDYETKKKISREDLIKSIQVYAIGGIAILLIIIFTLKSVLGV